MHEVKVSGMNSKHQTFGELQRGSKARDLRRQSMIELSFKKKFQCTHEVRVLRKNLGHQAFGALERI